MFALHSTPFGLFAAIMSIGDAFLNIGAAAQVHDNPLALRGRTPARELFWARTATVVLALAAAAFALFSHYTERASGGHPGCLRLLSRHRDLRHRPPFGISGGALSLLLSLTLFFAVSLATSPRPFYPDIEAVMDL